MTAFPSWFDYTLVLVMFAFMVAEVYVFALLGRRASSGTLRYERLRAYAFFISYQWTLVAVIAVVWLATGRPWSGLLLGSPNRWGFFVGLVLAGAYAMLMIAQRKAIADRPQVLERLRSGMTELEGIGPHTLRERRVWPFAAITAGFCEEVFFRGYLLTFFTSFAGIIAAVAICTALFGLYHAYYGPKGVLKTGVFGLLMTLLALWSASLIPVIIIHATIDLVSGDISYLVFSRAEAASE